MEAPTNSVSPQLPQEPSKKKSLSPLAWIGIGCGGLILIIILVTIVILGFVTKKVKDFTTNLQDDPVKTMAEIAVRTNPKLELVRSDNEKGTITVREKETGKEVTLSYEDIKNGKIGFTTAEGSVEIHANPQKTEEATIKIKNKQGEMVLGNNNAWPEWIESLLYPSATGTTKNFSMNQENMQQWNLSQTTTDSPEKVADFYKEQLRQNNYDITDDILQATEGKMIMLSGSIEKPINRQVNIHLSHESNVTTIQLHYSETKE